MDSWLTYPEYLAQHPGSALTEAEFTPRAVDAAFFIESATRWCASLAKEPEQLALLAQCQSRLVALSEEVSASWDGVTSVNNHGYTESYASGMDMQAYLGKRQSQIVHEVLSAPQTLRGGPPCANLFSQQRVSRWCITSGGALAAPATPRCCLA